MTKESLDFYTYDSYPNFAYCLSMYEPESKGLRDRQWSSNLTEVRSISPKFGIMEQQSGPNGWNTHMEAPAPRPGQLTLWTMQSIAHGADFISYFRWRTCTMGTEIYWHGILDYSNRENRRISEVKDVYKKLQKMKNVAGSKYEANVGIIKDYDNIWDAQLDVWHQRVEKASAAALFQAAQHTHTPIDYVYLTADQTLEKLQEYKVLFYPHATILNKNRVELLERYVKEGGTIVFGCRTGYKEMTGKCVMDKLPGLVTELTGTDIPEYSFIAPDAGPVYIDWEGTQLEGNVFVDLLNPIGANAKLLACYRTDYYAGEGALICNDFGKGKAYYYGTAFNEESARVFLEKLGVISPYKDRIKAPETCEIAIRLKDKKRYMFVLNYRKEPAEIEVKKEGTNLYTGEKVCGKIELNGYETVVIEI